MSPSGCEWPVSISILACSLAARLCDEDLDLLSALLVQLGDTLATISAQRACCQTTPPVGAASSTTKGPG